MAESTSDSVIDEALERFEESQEDSAQNRANAVDDIRFARMGEQWPDKIKRLREVENRPCLTINRLPTFVRQVVNEARQNKPGIVVNPVDDGADKDTAEVIGGLVRAIERSSNADIAYDTAIDHAVSGGFGFFRVGIDYAHPYSFDLEARIERIPNPLMVHWDTSSTAFDASDWNHAFVSDWVGEDEFKRRYPKAEPVSFEGDIRDGVAHWHDGEQIRLAEYWLRTEKTHKIYLMSDGKVIREDQLPEIGRKLLARNGMNADGLSEKDCCDAAHALLGGMGISVIKQRECNHFEVVRRIINGVEVLEENIWPGQTIPICPVWGEEIFSDGKRHFRSMIRDARDPQTMLNFWRSATTELVALAPRAPWVGPEGFIPKGQKAKWEQANNRSYAYLEYDASAGAAPQRTPFAGVPAGALQEALNASDDIKSIIGIYDSSLGARSNETSGRAILARQKQADNSNFHFIDNLSRAIKYAGQVLIEIIPSVYSDRKAIRILGDDMLEKVINLKTNAADPQGRIYDLSTGKYDVTVKAGPSFSTQREFAREALTEIMKQVPGSAPIVGDILMELMDFPGADKVAKRLQHLLPPQVQAAEGIATPGLMPGQPMPGAPGAPPVMPGQPGQPPQAAPPSPGGVFV
jgi:hypothetical protein